MKQSINESFIEHKEFDNWALALPENRIYNIFKIKIDDNPIEYMSIRIYRQFDDLVLLTPLELRQIKEHEYDTDYPQIGPINWNKLEILEELDESEAIKEITKDNQAIFYNYENE